MFLSIFSRIGEIEFFRKQHIKLDRTALPRTANGVLQMEVDLRTIESAVPFVDDIFQAKVIHSFAQGVRRHFPRSVIAHGVIRTRG